MTSTKIERLCKNWNGMSEMYCRQEDVQRLHALESTIEQASRKFEKDKRDGHKHMKAGSKPSVKTNDKRDGKKRKMEISTWKQSVGRDQELNRLKQELKELRARVTRNFLTRIHQDVAVATEQGIALAIDNDMVANSGFQYAESFLGFQTAACACGQQLMKFEQAHCENVLANAKKSDTGTLQKCISMWHRLDNTKKACICPVDPDTEGNCGLPSHLDLFTGTEMNGMQFPAPRQREKGMGKKKRPGSRRRLLTATQTAKATLSSMNCSKHTLTEGRTLCDWLHETLEKVRMDDENKNVVWEDTIPADVGAYLRSTCDTMDPWSVSFGALTVTFEGLGYSVENGPTSTRRRRLLARSDGGGC